MAKGISMTLFSKSIVKKNSLVLFIVYCIIILVLSARGIKGNPTTDTINDLRWKESGPLELSPERGRFALTFSLVENKSFFFSLPVAQFATPDLGFKNGHYVSLFAPAVSFIIIPGYIIGKWFGIAQVGSFIVISLFAVLNVILIRAIAVSLKINSAAATLASMIFLFATPAFAYGVTLYQHHISTFLLLVSIYLLLRWNTIWSLLIIWCAAALSISVDYPNFFFMFPIGIYALGRMIYVTREKGYVIFNVNFIRFISLIGIALPLLFFLWSNQKSYGSPFQLSGTVAAVKTIDGMKINSSQTKDLQVAINTMNSDQADKDKTAIGFFRTRNLLNGFYILFLSPDRGVIVYTPVVLFGLIGAFFLRKENQKILSLYCAIVGVNILLYSMWGDPYGGWAFGSRYLIPSFAILTVCIAEFLTKMKGKKIVLLIFSIVLVYSIAVNTLGALTSSRNPPSVEVAALEKLSGRQERYSFDRNIEFLQTTGSKSFVWREFGKNYVSPTIYYFVIFSSLVIVSIVMILALL